MSFIQKFFPEANDPLEFPEETNEDDDVSSSSYQSAKENLNSKSEVDMVDSGIKSDATKNSQHQSDNNKSDEIVETTTTATKKDVTADKLKDTYTSNKTVSTLINLLVEWTALHKVIYRSRAMNSRSRLPPSLE